MIKDIIFSSLIFGILLGILAPIPYIGIASLFAAILLSAPIVMVFLIMDSKLELSTVKDSIITGFISGFSVNFSFSMTYALIMLIMAKWFNYTTNFFITSMITNSPIWLFLTFVIFIGILFATTNAFSGFITFYIINFIRDIYERKHEELK